MAPKAKNYGELEEMTRELTIKCEEAGLRINGKKLEY